MMYPRFNKIYYLFSGLFTFFLSFGIGFFIYHYYTNQISKFTFNIVFFSLIGAQFLCFFVLFGFFIWERWTRYREPRSQIKFNFLQSILKANDSCLIVRNKVNKIIWCNNWNFLRSILNNKSVYYFNLNRVDKRIENLKINQSINFVYDYKNDRNEYSITLIKNNLLLICAKTELFKVSQMFLQQKPVFLIITLDKISSNSQQNDFERIETQILTQIRVELYEQLKNYDVLLFNSNPYEWMLIMSTSQLKKFRDKNFDFLIKIEIKIKEIHKILITFSVGSYLGYETIFKNRAMYEFNPAKLVNLYQKTLIARRMAQVRGGDQIILTDAFNAFTVYGKQRDLPKLDTSNVKNFLANFFLLVKKYSEIIIVGHKQADFDVFGAGTALSYFLKSRYKNKIINFVVNSVNDKTLKFVKSKIDKTFFKTHINLNSAKIFAKADPKKTLLIVIDTNNLEFVDFPNNKLYNFDQIFIDHHINCFKGNPILELINTNYSSASEIILSLMIQSNIKKHKQYNFNHDLDVLRLLLFGILIDTNNLQTQIGKNTLEVVNFVIKNGIKIEEMINEINHFKIDSSQSIDLNSGNFKANVIDKTKVVLQFRNDFLITAETAANLAEKYLANNKVNMVFAIGHDQNKNIYISGRCHSPYNVEVICKKFDGGGDSRRAAAKIVDIDAKLGIITQKLIKLVTEQN